MRRISALKYALREACLPAVFACVFAYLGYHLVQGNLGLLAWMQLEQRLDTLEREAADLAEKRQTLEHKVTLLRSDGLDPDMLDQQTRAILGYVHPQDVLILTEDR